MSEIPQAATVQAQESRREAEEILTTAKAVVVTNDDEYRAAGAAFSAIKAKLKELEARRVTITAPMNAALKSVNDLFRIPKEALEHALSLYERPMSEFAREQARKKREAEEAARRETERLRREKEDEERRERERLAQIQREREQAERAAAQTQNPIAAFAARQEVDRLAVAEAEQSQTVVDTIREKVTVTAPVEFVPSARAAGTSVRTNWKFRITDPTAIPREFLIPDEKKIGEFARTMKEKASLPGVEFYDEIKIGGR